MNKELESFLQRYPDTKQVEAFIIDLCGNAVGKRFPASHLEKIYTGQSQLCAATYLLDVTGNSADPLGYGFSDGDPDADAYPVSGTLKPIPWLNEASAQCLLVLKNSGSDDSVWFEPRFILQKVVEKFAELELRPIVAVELEFYLLDARRDEDGFPQTPVNPRTGERTSQGKVFNYDELNDFREVLQAIDQAATAQGIPASTSLSEYGAGQFEVNLEHGDDPVKAADDAALFRRLVTQVARQKGFNATFMSKPFSDQAGNGMHIHVSVSDKNGQNIFDPSSNDGDARLAQAVAGLQHLMAESFAIFAPSINSFRRYKPDQFVPVTKDWGENNRSVAFRTLGSDAKSRRVEHRVACADANPYLVMASVLAGVHFGLSHGISPEGEKNPGNAGAQVDETLPLVIWQALEQIESAERLSQYLGERFLEAYVSVKRAEFHDFMSQTFSQEFDWYL